jgi:YD repeat-containing protein
MGNRATMVNSVSGTTNYTYDNADRLLTAGATAFTWDNNGNQLTKGAATYAYDVANRLTQVVNGGTTVQYAYDGDGKRASKTVNGTATSYAYDVNAALPVVLTETTSGIATTYLYGTDLLARYDNAGTPTYYHADGLGSVRALSNSAGQSVATYNYDAFGAVRQARSSLRGSRWMMRWG